MRIAVTTDFSDLSTHAFRPSASLARAFEADLCLVHQRRPSLLAPPERVEDYKDELESRLEDLARNAPAFAGVSVKPVFLRGESVTALAEGLGDFDLVVMATHGRTGLRHLLLGSFAERLIRVSPRHVLVSRIEDADFQPKKILVAHDFTKAKTGTTDVALDWAQKFSAEVKLLSVVDTKPAAPDASAEFRRGSDALYDGVRQDARRQLQEIAGEERWGDLSLEIVVTDGDPVEKILEHSTGCDLVVVGRHGRASLERLFLGTVAEQVIRSAPCSVLVVEHPA